MFLLANRCRANRCRVCVVSFFIYTYIPLIFLCAHNSIYVWFLGWVHACLASGMRTWTRVSFRECMFAPLCARVHRSAWSQACGAPRVHRSMFYIIWGFLLAIHIHRSILERRPRLHALQPRQVVCFRGDLGGGGAWAQIPTEIPLLRVGACTRVCVCVCTCVRFDVWLLLYICMGALCVCVCFLLCVCARKPGYPCMPLQSIYICICVYGCMCVCVCVYVM